MSPEQRSAVLALAASQGWDKHSNHELGLLLWALFRYYAERLEQWRS